MRLLSVFFATFALFLFSTVVCGSSDYSDNDREICFERPSTGDKLLVKNDKIYFSDPSNRFACHVWEFCPDLVTRGATEYAGRFIPIRITDSRCFVPGSAVCRDPASYFVAFDLFDQHKVFDGESVLDVCVSSSRLLIGTTSDTCCERTNALIGEWVPSSDCSSHCDCSTDCDLLDECLVRDVKGKDLALRYVDGNLVVSGKRDDCFVYPTVRKESRLIVGPEVCDNSLGGFGPLYTRSRSSCDDTTGTYFCSQREDTLTLYYTDDFCESRTAVLGATFRTVDCESCPAVCTCTGNDFPGEGSSSHSSSHSDSDSEGEGQTGGSSSHSGSSAGQGQTGGSSSHSGSSAGQGQTGGSSSHSGSSAGQGQTGGSSSHSGSSAGQGQTGGSSSHSGSSAGQGQTGGSSSHGSSAGQGQTSGGHQSSHHSAGVKLAVPGICIVAVGVAAFLV